MRFFLYFFVIMVYKDTRKMKIKYTTPPGYGEVKEEEITVDNFAHFQRLMDSGEINVQRYTILSMGTFFDGGT